MAQRRAHTSLPASEDIKAGLTPRALTKQEFGRRLNGLMIGKEWSQSDLAKNAGVGRDAISTYIRGLTFPTPKSLAKLAAALGVTSAELLPNSLMQAMDDEFPAVEMKAAAGHPGKAWLRINRAVSFSAGARILAIINEDDEAERQQD